MILQINDEWRIISDPNQWIAQRYIVRQKGDHVGKGDWKSEAYFTRPDTAALWIVSKRVREIEGTFPAADGLEAMGTALHAIERDIRRIADAVAAG